MSSNKQQPENVNEQGKIKIPLVVILGSTAVGKTEIAIRLAERFDGEIVSADSRLFYRGMDIGTAKPTAEERKRVPHHLIDVSNPDEVWSLALFQLHAHRAIREIYDRHHLPFLVGGTGQFVRSIIEGWKIPPAQPNPHMRSVLERWAKQIGPGVLHSRLSTLDHQAASSIDPSNVRRSIRALEVIFTTGRRFSEQRMSGEKLYQHLLLGLTRPRPELYDRIDARIMKMLDDGFVDEVQRLLDEGYSPDLPTMSAIGYGELVAFIQQKISIDEAVAYMKRRTREFVRRQANWFKEVDPDITWFSVNASMQREMEKVINEWLKCIQWEKTLQISPKKK